ncbi:MAG: SdrD B-like domain-containing protein, partial [Acidimicrobiales bacterium]
MQRRTTGGLISALTLAGLSTFLGGSAGAVGPCGSTLVSGDDNRIGNLVFADLDGDAAFEPADGESGLPGVTVELWADLDGDGIFEPGSDDGSAACVATTDADGRYHFSPTSSGNWFVAVPIAPAGTESSDGATTDATTDNVDDGAPTTGYAAVSAVLALDLSDDQPLGEAAPGAASGSDELAADADGGPVYDRDSNLTIDFGFQPLVVPPTSPSTTTPSTTTPSTTSPSTTAPSTT